MIIDLNEMCKHTEFISDLCIIGSGAAGLALVSELLDTRLNIIVLESGGYECETKTQQLYDVEISGLPLPGATEGRFRVFGGSTTQWGGQALPLMPIDFEKRAWIPYSGWPMTYHELSPYYTRACQFLLVDHMNFDTDLFAYLKTKPPTFNASYILYHFSKWSPTPNVRENYVAKIKTSKHCTLLLHANATRITLNENHHDVQQIEARSLEGQSVIVKAKYFVICAGGIESARLLLANHHQNPNGLGNDHGCVGRYFQDHPSAAIGWIKTKHPKKIQQWFNVFHKRGLKYSVRTTAHPKWQDEKQTLNMSSGITFVDDNITLDHLKNIYRDFRKRNINRHMIKMALQVMMHPHDILSPAFHYAFYGRSYAKGAKLRVGLTSEQEPNSESRITLSHRQDALGMPLANVCWKLTELTRYSMQQFALNLRHQFESQGLGTIEFEPWLFDQEDKMEYITDQLHHIGSTRMHDSPRYGVVDKHCRVHDIHNLFIGSSSVFPTGGHSNPTLTIIALCIRLADHLKQVCQR